MNERKYELMEKYLNGEVTVSGLIDIIVDLENPAIEVAKFEVVDYLLPSIKETESVLDDLKEMAKKYGHVSVADYYDLLGNLSHFQDSRYGWSAASLHKTRILARRGLRDESYYIEFPPVEEL